MVALAATANVAIAQCPDGTPPPCKRPVAVPFAGVEITGDAEDSVESAERAFEVIGRHPVVLSQRPAAFLKLKLGEARRAEAVYAELLARAETDQVSRMARSLAAGDLGRVDEAVAYAIESIQRCDHLGLFWARAPFAGDAMRAHPRYPELLRAMGL